jgi:orotate phosphoribosyltransferase
MAGASDNLLEFILKTKALSIWNREKGPIFWYTAGVPGPFFVNTEWIIGRDLAASLVEDISGIIEATPDLAARTARLDEAVLSAYRGSAQYQAVIAALATKTREVFPGGYDFISGGERRDWLFSIPLAQELGADHAHLFKDQSLYSRRALKPGEKALHVADLINNAASYFERWFPALEKAGLKCAGTISVNSRGNGAEKLEQAGIRVATLARIDVPLFEQLSGKGLIDSTTVNELAVYAGSPQEWAEKYLIGRADLFDVAHADKKSFERMQSFFAQDPWKLRDKHAAFFDTMQREIAARLKNAA